MIKARICCLWLFLNALTIESSYAQYENVWAFGAGAGLDFNNMSNSLPSILPTKVYAELGVSICDKNGDLLFYTDGSTIWDKNHNIMPNGNNITGLGGYATYSAMMGAVIFPQPNHPKRYYIFSAISRSGGAPTPDDEGKLFYSVVDMDLNNGLGDVDNNKAGVLVDTGLMESIIVVPGNHCDYWVIGTTYYHQRPYNPLFDTIPTYYNAAFKAYNITESGVNLTPTTSLGIPVPLFNSVRGHLTSVIKSSFDNKRIAIPYSPFQIGDPGAGFRMFNFDRTSGIFSNELLISDSSLHRAHNICFSPNDSLLYLSSMEIIGTDTFSIISQFDISTVNATTINNSRQVVYRRQNGGWRNPMKIGPDGKLYISHYPNLKMSVIPYPDLPAPSCGLWRDTIDFSSHPNYSGNFLGYVLSNHLGRPEPASDTLTSIQYVSPSCMVVDSLEAVLYPSDTLSTYYVWDDSSTNTGRVIREDGVYWVSYIRDCTYHIDSFYVSFNKLNIRTTGSCYNENGGSARIEKSTAKDTNNYSYIWVNHKMDTLSQSAEITGIPPGSYWVYVYSDYCKGMFSFSIETLPDSIEFQSITPMDTLINYRTSIRITTESDAIRWTWNPITYLDNPHDGSPVSRPEKSITYQVIGYGPLGCSDTGEVKIKVDYPSKIKVPTAFSPNGDGLNDEFKIYLHQYEKLIAFKVFNRWGNLVFETNNINRGWNGQFQGQPAPSDVYMYYIEVLLPGPDGGKVQTLKGDVSLIR